MRKGFVVATLACIASARLFGAECAPGFLVTYPACDITTASGVINFSNFSIDLNFPSGGAAFVPNTAIYINPFGTGTYDFGFTFSARDPNNNAPLAFAVSGAQQYLLEIRYQVNGPGAELVGSTRAFVSATATCGVTCGSASLTKDIFANPPAPPVGGTPLAVVNVNDVQVTSNQIFFGPVSSFGVRDTVSVQANNATATLTAFGNAFETPEPATLAVAGFALAALGVLRRKRT